MDTNNTNKNLLHKTTQHLKDKLIVNKHTDLYAQIDQNGRHIVDKGHKYFILDVFVQTKWEELFLTIAH